MRTSFIALAGIAAVVACSPKADGDKDSAAAVAKVDSAKAAVPANTLAMRDSAGHELGSLTLSDVSGGIMIMGNLHGVAPGEHGIHLHMTGSCEPTFAAAGGHWNPATK